MDPLCLCALGVNWSRSGQTVCVAHLSAADPTASHRDPCGPMRRHLRGQHAQGQHHATSHLQISRDRDLYRDLAILARRVTSWAALRVRSSVRRPPACPATPCVSGCPATPPVCVWRRPVCPATPCDALCVCQHTSSNTLFTSVLVCAVLAELAAATIE